MWRGIFWGILEKAISFLDMGKNSIFQHKNNFIYIALTQKCK
jgi:hypothetical protein